MTAALGESELICGVGLSPVSAARDTIARDTIARAPCA